MSCSGGPDIKVLYAILGIVLAVGVIVFICDRVEPDGRGSPVGGPGSAELSLVGKYVPVSGTRVSASWAGESPLSVDLSVCPFDWPGVFVFRRGGEEVVGRWRYGATGLVFWKARNRCEEFAGAKEVFANGANAGNRIIVLWPAGHPEELTVLRWTREL